MSRVAYIRVSTEDQNTARQDEMMKHQKIDKVFTEKISGKDMNRPQLQAMLSWLRDGDVVVIESISRLSRSTRDFLNILDQLEKKGVALVSLKESIDTSTPTGRFMVSVFAALAELERDQIHVRQTEGIAEAKKAGKYRGRVPIQIDEHLFLDEVRKWKDGKQTAADTMRTLQLKKSTFYRKVNEMGLV